MTKEMLARFHELGPELKMTLEYTVGYGWTGRAMVVGENGGDVATTFDAEMEGEDDPDDFAAFLNNLYERLAAKVDARS